jgi:hypothetical protein
MNAPQGSREWRMARLGKVTASRFGDIMAGTESGAYCSYAKQLRTELAMLEKLKAGEPVEFAPDFYSAATAWGTRFEPMARAEYEFKHDCDVEVQPFLTHHAYPFVGASPDGIWHSILRTGLEIKCPYDPGRHAETTVHGMAHEHMAQVQGGMWVTGLESWVFISFDPRRKDSGRYYEQLVWRDAEYIERLQHMVLGFWDFVNSGQEIPIASDSVPILF